jgi:hypothetical protein
LIRFSLAMRRLALVAVCSLLTAAPAAAALREPAPSAAEFGRGFVATANAYSAAHGRAARLASPDCVQAAPGKYMCSYAIMRPRRPLECHIIQATWTPYGPSTYTITLSGRVRRCSSLQAALDSL